MVTILGLQGRQNTWPRQVSSHSDSIDVLRGRLEILEQTAQSYLFDEATIVIFRRQIDCLSFCSTILECYFCAFCKVQHAKCMVSAS